jgi:hypothetical protein
VSRRRRKRSDVTKRKRPAPGDRKLPLNSPNWMPITDAYRQGKARLGSSVFAIEDLQRGLKGGQDGRDNLLRSKRRQFIGGKDVEELLEATFWRDFGFAPWGEGLTLVTRTGHQFGSSAIVFVWKPDLEKIWPAEAAASSNEDTPRQRPGPKHRDEWPTHVAACLIRIARDEPSRLSNLDRLAKDASEFLDSKKIKAPQDYLRRIRPVIAGLLRYVR